MSWSRQLRSITGTERSSSVMEMSTDITQIRELESQLTSLGLLIGSVSHGLKGLLNGLAGGIYLVNTGFKKEEDDRVEKGWEIVETNVGRIRSMVSDILYYAKEREPNWETVSCRRTCRRPAQVLVEGRAAGTGSSQDTGREVLSAGRQFRR